MSPSLASEWVDLARTGGPYLVSLVLGWALVHRDRQLRALYDRVIDLSTAQTAAQHGTTSALAALRDVVARLED